MEKEKTKFNWWIVVTIALIMILIISSIILTSKIETLVSQNEVRKELVDRQLKKLEELSKERIIEKDSLIKEISIRENINKELEQKFKDKEATISDIKKEPIYIPLTLMEKANYFNYRYETEENSNDEKQILLQKNTSDKVIKDLQIGDKALKIIPLQDEQIGIKNNIIINLEKDKNDIKTQNLSLENEIQERLELEELMQERLKISDSQIKKLNKKSKIDRMLIPIGMAVGLFIGTQIK